VLWARFIPLIRENIANSYRVWAAFTAKLSITSLSSRIGSSASIKLAAGLELLPIVNISHYHFDILFA